MTSRKSFFNFEIMAESVKQAKYIMILHTIALFLITTIPVYMELQSENHYVRLAEQLSMWLSGFNPLVGCAAVGIPIITVIYLFSYLFKSNSVQFFNSMPYTRECMYVSRAAACVVSVILPVLLVFAVNSVIYVVMEIGEYFPYADMTAGLGTMLICYFAMLCLCIFAVSVSGNFFAVLIVTGFLGLAYLATTLAINVSFTAWFDNLSIKFSYEAAYIFPPSLLFYRVYGVESISAANYIYSAAYAVFFLGLGLWAYVKRRGENTNKFFAYKGVGVFLKYFVSLVGSLFFGALFLDLSNKSIIVGYIGYILILFVIYVLLQAIFEKDMRGMFSNMKHFAVFAVIWAVVLIPLNMGVLENIEPDRHRSSAIAVDYGNIYMVFHDKENIDAAFELYESAEKYNDNQSLSYRSVTFTSNPDNPLFKLERTKYVYSYDKVKEYEKTVFDSEEYKNMLLEELDRESSWSYINLSGNSYYVNTDSAVEDYGAREITAEDFDKLKEILKSDIVKYDYDSCKESGCYATIQLIGANRAYGYRARIAVPVYLCYEETVRFMKEDMKICSVDYDLEKVTAYVKGRGGDEYCIFATNDPEEIEALFDCSAGYGAGFFPMYIEIHYGSGVELIDISYENLSEEVKKMINPEGAEYEDIPELELNMTAEE